MSDAPWTKEQAEKWAGEADGKFKWQGVVNRLRTVSMAHRIGYLAGLAKAAEMIEKCPTIVQMEPGRQFGWYEEREHLHHKYQRQAKLVNIKPVEKGKSDE